MKSINQYHIVGHFTSTNTSLIGIIYQTRWLKFSLIIVSTSFVNPLHASLPFTSLLYMNLWVLHEFATTYIFRGISSPLSVCSANNVGAKFPISHFGWRIILARMFAKRRCAKDAKYIPRPVAGTLTCWFQYFLRLDQLLKTLYLLRDCN